jgi:L,D-transpeptidase ErfK/SrfK
VTNESVRRRVFSAGTAAWAIFALALAMSAASAQSQSNAVVNLSIEVNVPAYRLDVIGGKDRLASYSVAVGLPRYATPLGDFALTQITWNPWWNPPKTYWARHEKITPPGPTNPMGKVKMLVGGSVYLHATPFVSSMGRAASHGCVRMRTDDAVALARLVQRTTGAAIQETSLDSLLGKWNETRELNLPVAVPVSIEYHLVELRGDTLLLHPDVYRLSREDLNETALRALADAAYDTSRIDRITLRRFVRRARTDHVRISIDQLKSTHADRNTVGQLQEFPYARRYVAPTEFAFTANTFHTTVRTGCA